MKCQTDKGSCFEAFSKQAQQGDGALSPWLQLPKGRAGQGEPWAGAPGPLDPKGSLEQPLS